MPSVSSTESALEVVSHPADKGVTGPACGAASTSGSFSKEEEEDEVGVNCEDLQSTLTAEVSV